MNEEKKTEFERTRELFRQVMAPLWHVIRAQVHKFITKEYGITSAQFHVIRRIKHGVTSVSKLAELMQVSRPNISRTVDDLVKSGLVNRLRDPVDRRNVKLSLTDKGEDLFKDLHIKHDEILSDQFSMLSKDELEKLAQALEILKKVIDHNIRKE